MPLGIASRSPRGERGLKFPPGLSDGPEPPGRSPRGERGLKSPQIISSDDFTKSLPSRGARVEISEKLENFVLDTVAPLAGSEG